MNRQEHLQWCKDRAIEYLDAGDPQQAFASMASDLGKHDETRNHVGIQLGGMQMLMPSWINSDHNVRSWIVGFN